MTLIFTDIEAGIIGAFIRGNSYTKHASYLSSTGDTLMHEMELVAWRVDGEVYAMFDGVFNMHIINDICERLAKRRPFDHDRERDRYTCNGRPLGRDEIVCITGIGPPESRSL